MARLIRPLTGPSLRWLLPVPVDKSQIPKGVTLFNGFSSVAIDPIELFKLAVLKHELPPAHTSASDWLYRQSKVSHYHGIYDDFLEVTDTGFVNKATDDRMMNDISEWVGIGVGVHAATKAFNIEAKDIARIPRSRSQQKYLDYSFAFNGNRVEFETKGTTSKAVKPFIDDILAKKKAKSQPAWFRFGTVTILQKPGSAHASVLHLCDDEPTVADGDDSQQNNVVQHYLAALDIILDPKLYNAIVRREKSGRRFKPVLRPFFGRYQFEGHEFVGDFFDHRLGYQVIAAADDSSEESLARVFRLVTEKLGRTKIFIGVRRDIFEQALGGSLMAAFSQLPRSTRKLDAGESREWFLDTDGILIIVSRHGHDAQVEEQFGENEVRRRMALLILRKRGEPPECGEPCRSREKEGKPCEIRTYRGTCHFHG